MKKILFTILAIYSLNSCGSDDSNEISTPTNPSIVGTWKYSNEIVISGKDNSTVLFTENPPACDKQTNDIYSESGQYTENLYQFVGGNCINSTNIGTYSYNKDTKKLSVTIPNLGTDVSDVVKLDANNLHIQYDTTHDYNNDGFNDKWILQYYK